MSFINCAPHQSKSKCAWFAWRRERERQSERVQDLFINTYKHIHRVPTYNRHQSSHHSVSSSDTFSHKTSQLPDCCTASLMYRRRRRCARLAFDLLYRADGNAARRAWMWVAESVRKNKREEREREWVSRIRGVFGLQSCCMGWIVALTKRFCVIESTQNYKIISKLKGWNVIVEFNPYFSDDIFCWHLV